MPIQYSSPFSQFVDPGSTEIAEEYKNRFLTNYSAASKIEQEMAALKAAPFEGDRNLRNNLVSSTQGVLNNLAEKGNYEHMTIPVMGAAKEYAIKSQPISENLARYQTYLEELDTARKEGKIDHEDYEGTLNLATKNYTGLVQNPDGTYGNTFSGLAYVERPDIQQMINDQIDMVASDMTASERNYLSAEISKGNIVQTENGRYAIKVGNKVEYISEGKIEQAISSVFSDSQVQQYLQRKGKIRTANLTDEQLLDHKNKVLTGFSSRYDELNEALDKAKSPEEKQAISEAMSGLIQETGRVQGLNDPEQLRDLAARREISSIISEYTNAAKASAFTKVHEDSLLFDWDKKHLKTLEAAETLTGEVAVTVPGALQQIVSPSGTTITSKHNFNSQTNQAINAMKEPGYFDELAEGLTFDQITKMSVVDFNTLEGGKATPERIALFNRMKSSATEMLAQQYAINRVVEEAGEATGETKEARTNRALQIEGIQPMLNHFKQAYGVEDAEALNMVRYFLNEEEMYDASPFKSARTGAKKRTFKLLDEVLGFMFGYDTGMLDESAQLYPNLYQDNVEAMAEITKISSWEDMHEDVREALMQSDKILNGYLKDPTIRQFTPTITPNIPGMSEEEMGQLNTIFDQTSPFAQGTAFVSKNTGKLIAFDEFVAEETGLEITPETSVTSTGKVMFNPANAGPQGATLQVNYSVGEDKTQVSAQIPLSQITGSPTLNDYLGSLSYSFYRQALIQRGHGVQNPLVTAVLPPGTNSDAPEGARITFEVDVENGTITPKNGPSAGKPMDMNTALDKEGLISILQSQQFSYIIPGE
jgi:hypothetical protein